MLNPSIAGPRIERNGCRRSPNFDDLVRLAESVAPVDLRPLWTRSMKVLDFDPQIDSDHARLLRLLIRLSSQASWRIGKPTSYCGTETMVRFTAWSERKVVRVLSELEAGHLILRLYTERGHRDGIDLRPFLATISDRWSRVQTLFRRSQLDHHGHDLSTADTRDDETTLSEMTSGDVKTGTPYTTTENPLMDSVSGIRARETANGLFNNQPQPKPEPVVRSRGTAIPKKWLAGASPDTPQEKPKGSRAKVKAITPMPIWSQAIRQIRLISPDFDVALTRAGFPLDGRSDPGRYELLSVADDWRAWLGIPIDVWQAAIPRHTALTLAAIIALGLTKSRYGYDGPPVRNAAGWCRSLLEAPSAEVDIWASVQAEIRRRVH